MTTIKATKGDFVQLINGLFAVQNLKGKDFSLTISKNIVKLKEALAELEEAGKPSEEFMALAEQVNIVVNENKEDSKEIIAKLEEENKELVKARQTQMDEVTELMKEELELDLEELKEDYLPEEITAQQINNLIKIIK
tara:strand:+ start:13201 stop:13614 length:414 start_codon:yes stop_codon:yes gene_type:complete